jgi:HEPN domain-containing protein
MANQHPDLDAYKLMLVDELFLHSADQNYIVARWCFFNELNESFYCNAAQAIEKYCKAALLLNGKSAKHYGHNILELYKALHAFASELLPESFTKPIEQVKRLPHWVIGIDGWREETTQEFVERLNQEGDPNNRYHLYGYSRRSCDIFKLDQVVLTLRNVACHLEALAYCGDENDRTTNREEILAAPQKPKRMVGSEFARLAEQEQSPLNHAALNLNFSFAHPEREHVPISNSFGGRNSPLFENILQYKGSQLSTELTQWLIENIYLPKEVIKHLQEEMLASA